MTQDWEKELLSDIAASIMVWDQPESAAQEIVAKVRQLLSHQLEEVRVKVIGKKGKFPVGSFHEQTIWEAESNLIDKQRQALSKMKGEV
jgi:hypothetical protein